MDGEREDLGFEQQQWMMVGRCLVATFFFGLLVVC